MDPDPRQSGETFSIVYRTGSPERCAWHRVLDTFPSKDATREKRDEIERMGYKTLIFRTYELNALGMPEGWNAEQR